MPPRPLYADVAALLDGGLPEPPAPVLLRRTDGRAIFYANQVNLLFGDPESGKTLVAQAAASEALMQGRKVLFVDIDHNGLEGTICRFLDMEVSEEILRNPDRFRYAEPEDQQHLMEVIADAVLWRPAVAVVDSIGELLPMMKLSSNSPDDFTISHTRVLKPLALCGAAVVAIDHSPKNSENKSNGPTGTAAKRRAIGGTSIRVELNEPFAPGRAGSCFLTLDKDRHGGLRQHCGDKPPVVGLFTLDSSGHTMKWSIRPGAAGDSARVAGVSEDDIAALDALNPPPTTVREVRERLKWRASRATEAMREWRKRSGNVPGNGKPDLTLITDEGEPA